MHEGVLELARVDVAILPLENALDLLVVLELTFKIVSIVPFQHAMTNSTSSDEQPTSTRNVPMLLACGVQVPKKARRGTDRALSVCFNLFCQLFRHQHISDELKAGRLLLLRTWNRTGEENLHALGN
jgi:hypothetical protein